jgi:N-acetylgalactosamine kinase
MENLQSSEKLLEINYPNDLVKIYEEVNVSEQLKRYEKLIDGFQETYNLMPSYIARAPGRVNLIGEHLDYEGFAVLPMAIENDILIALNFNFEEVTGFSSNTKINIQHVEPQKFPTYNYTTPKFKKLDLALRHDWVNYVIAGYNSIINYIHESSEKDSSHFPTNINFLITGNIPTASGLSSSSALTVASALAFTRIFNLQQIITKNELSKAAINYERSVGTACGGMDQTISIYAEKNKAKLIEFNPNLRTTSVNLPKNVSFIIANSLTDSPKIDTLAFRYNKRVLENKLGLAIICRKLSLNLVYSTLIELKTYLNVTFSELSDLIEKNLKSGNYSIEEILNELNPQNEIFSIENILKNIPYYQLVLSNNSIFVLRERLLHVCGEAERVLSFYEICQVSTCNESIIELGKLMNLSHKSCKEMYECSSTELDKLVQYSIQNRALGARLTGAGWGGCSVFLVENENLDYLMKKLNKYYAGNEKKTDEFYFKTKACQGASIVNL